MGKGICFMRFSGFFTLSLASVKVRPGEEAIQSVAATGILKLNIKGNSFNYFELGGARYRPIKGYGRYASTGPVHSAPRPLLNQNKHRCIRNLYVYLRLAAETPSVQLFGTICQPPGTPAKAQTLETYP